MSTNSLFFTAAGALSLLGLAIWLGVALHRANKEVGSRADVRRMHFDD